MGISSTSKRKTYRSNVKKRPLNQNGLEAQYQGLNISEVNIDHAGLAIIGRGGTGRRRSYTKTQNRYIVQSDDSVLTNNFTPEAKLVFNRDTNAHTDLRNFYNNLQITLTAADGTAKTYKFLKSGGTQGALVGGSVEVDISHSKYTYDLKEILIRFKEAIAQPPNGHTFTHFVLPANDAINVDSNYSNGTVFKISLQGINTPIGAASISYSGNASNQILPAPTSYITAESLQYWALEGTKTIKQDPEKFYEDIRVDHIQSAEKRGHSLNGDRSQHDSLLANSVFGTGLSRYNWNHFNSDPPLRVILASNYWSSNNTGRFFRPPFWSMEKSEMQISDAASVGQGASWEYIRKIETRPSREYLNSFNSFIEKNQAIAERWFPKKPQVSLGGVTPKGAIIINEDQKISTLFPPQGLVVNTRKKSDEIRIRSYPLREEIFNTYKSDHAWVEDSAWIAHEHHRTSSQSWTLLQSFVSDHWGDKQIKFNSVPSSGAKLYLNSNLITAYATPAPLVVCFGTYAEINSHIGFNSYNSTARVDISENNTVSLVASAVADIINTYKPNVWSTAEPGKDFYTSDSQGSTVRIFYRALPNPGVNHSFAVKELHQRHSNLTVTQSGTISIETINGLTNGIKKVLNHIYTPNPYHKNMHEEMSGRCDVFHRVERALELHNILIYERHKASVFDQYLDPHIDYINIYENQFPKKDYIQADIAFEDLRGKRKSLGPQWTNNGLVANSENLLSDWNPDETDDQPVLFIDYFDQEPLKNHKYVEDKRYTRIDDAMMDVLVKYTIPDRLASINAPLKRSLDRREFQESDYIITGTGFINSTTSVQDGIVYREMAR